MGHREATVHGFRSAFRDWAADTGQSDAAAELALAHVPASRVVAAYKRSDLLDQRRTLMGDWASFLEQPRGILVPFPPQAA
jgi:hypothetical protein